MKGRENKAPIWFSMFIVAGLMFFLLFSTIGIMSLHTLLPKITTLETTQRGIGEENKELRGKLLKSENRTEALIERDNQVRLYINGFVHDKTEDKIEDALPAIWSVCGSRCHGEVVR